METGNKKKILIIDDDPNIRHAIKRFLIIEGKYKIEEADGFNAKEQLKAFSPHLVILDIKMPGESGYEILTNLRVDGGTSNMKVIGMSGISGGVGAAFMDALRADAYFEKPFDNNELKEKVEKLLAENS